MSRMDDQVSVLYTKESRMRRARQFIREWLTDPDLQSCSGQSLDSLTTMADSYHQRIRNDSDELHPIVSSIDLKEAALEVLSSERKSMNKHKELDHLEAIIRNDRVR
jgi:hypothetical protein